MLASKMPCISWFRNHRAGYTPGLRFVRFESLQDFDILPEAHLEKKPNLKLVGGWAYPSEEWWSSSVGSIHVEKYKLFP